jgi:hypothetical protein
MSRFLMLLGIVIFAAAIVQDISRAQTAQKTGAKGPEAQYSVMNPWAEVDPTPVRGISPRLDGLAGKKVGIFANFKRAAMPMAESVEKRLKSMYPTIQVSIFHSTDPNVTETETKRREEFIAWIQSVDGVISLVGD